MKRVLLSLALLSAATLMAMSPASAVVAPVKASVHLQSHITATCPSGETVDGAECVVPDPSAPTVVCPTGTTSVGAPPTLTCVQSVAARYSNGVYSCTTGTLSVNICIIATTTPQPACPTSDVAYQQQCWTVIAGVVSSGNGEAYLYPSCTPSGVTQGSVTFPYATQNGIAVGSSLAQAQNAQSEYNSTYCSVTSPGVQVSTSDAAQSPCQSGVQVTAQEPTGTSDAQTQVDSLALANGQCGLVGTGVSATASGTEMINNVGGCTGLVAITIVEIGFWTDASSAAMNAQGLVTYNFQQVLATGILPNGTTVGACTSAQTQSTSSSAGPSVSAQPGDELYGVSCPTATQCFAGGYYEPANEPIFATGTLSNGVWSWTQPAAVPNWPTGDISNVTCASSQVCFFVGWSGYYAQNIVAEYLYANGSWSWTRILKPAPDSSGGGWLETATCVSVLYCIVGGSDWAHNAETAVLTSGNGTVWVTTAMSGTTGLRPYWGGAITSMTCIATSECLAMGQSAPSTTTGAVVPLLEIGIRTGTTRWSWNDVVMPYPKDSTTINYGQGIICPTSATSLPSLIPTITCYYGGHNDNLHGFVGAVTVYNSSTSGTSVQFISSAVPGASGPVFGASCNGVVCAFVGTNSPTQQNYSGYVAHFAGDIDTWNGVATMTYADSAGGGWLTACTVLASGQVIAVGFNSSGVVEGAG